MEIDTWMAGCVVLHDALISGVPGVGGPSEVLDPVVFPFSVNMVQAWKILRVRDEGLTH